MRDKIVVLYHNNCIDGFTSAYIAQKYFGQENDMVEYIPINYGDGIPNLNYNNIANLYILDFSFSQDEMKDLYSKINEYGVILLDHHKTAKENLDGWLGCTIDTNESGASLTWKHFFGYKIPNLVRYVKDRDLWLWEEPGSRQISAYISSFDFTFDNWNGIELILEHNIDLAYNEGEAILRQQKKIVKNIVENNSHEIYIDNYLIRAVNSSLYQSEIGEEILKQFPDSPFSTIYYIDNKYTYYSLRSRGDFDVSDIAKLYGGGGHSAASGFRLLKNKTP